jgi:hypothetical protein
MSISFLIHYSVNLWINSDFNVYNKSSGICRLTTERSVWVILNTFASENSLSWPLFFVILPKTWPAQREVGSKWPLDIKYLLEVRVAEGRWRLMQLGGVNFVGLDNAVGQLLTRPHVCITHFPVTESTPIHVKLAFQAWDHISQVRFCVWLSYFLPIQIMAGF